MNVEKIVAGIINQVRHGGDQALILLTKRFDRVDMRKRGILVSKGEIASAKRETGPAFARLVKSVARNIAAYHKRQLPAKARFINAHGARVGWFYAPIDRVGIYIPGGTAPLVSTALMTIVPAKVAGVKEIIVATPPGRDGKINPFILCACSLLGVNSIVRAGGAQAIAALALGTGKVPKVALIAGPGNIYVTEAKRQLYGTVGIDMTAGPSEVAIIADETASPAYIAADLLSQAEHDPNSAAVLFTDSAKLIARVRKEVDRQAASLPRKGIIMRVKKGGLQYIRCRSLSEAVEAANKMAPEHLEIMTRRSGRLIKSISNAGAVFAGEYTTTALGDYVAGPSHVLPTGATARHFSVLSVDTFLKRISYVGYNKGSLKKAAGAARQLARLEGLEAHARAVGIRIGRGMR